MKHSPPRELTDAFEEFKDRGPQYLDAETYIKMSAYQFGERVLIVYEESEAAGVVILYSPNLGEAEVLRKSESIHSG